MFHLTEVQLGPITVKSPASAKTFFIPDFSIYIIYQVYWPIGIAKGNSVIG